jgi:HK97 family phage prohead protease
MEFSMDTRTHNFECSIATNVDATFPPDRFRFVASNSQVNRNGDIVELDGWDTSNWEKNPVILWQHDSKLPPIGRGVNIQKDKSKNALIVDVEFADRSINPLAGTVHDLIKHGYLKGVSVGFKPMEYSERTDTEDANPWFPPLHITKQELLEISVVNIPANPGTLLVTNSAQRELAYQHGIIPGKVQRLIFEEKDISKCQEWAKNHDFKVDKVSQDGGCHVFEQAEETVFQDLRPITLEKGIKAFVGKPLITTPAAIIPRNNEIVFPKEYLEAMNLFVKHSSEQASTLKELKDAIKGLASLVDAVSERETVTPGESPERMSEQYLAQVRDSLKSATELFMVK